MKARTEAFDDVLTRLSAGAAALAHPARLELLRVLAARGTCVCGQLVDALPLSQPSVSRHLKVLKDAGLVRGEIDGPRSCYCIDADALAALQTGFADFFSALPSADDDRCC